MASAADAWGPRRTQPLRSNSTSSPIPWMPLPPMPGLLELPPMPPLLPLGAAHGMGLLAPLQASLPLPSLPSPLNSPGFTDIAVQQGFAQHSGAALAWNATSSPPHVPSVAPSAEQQPPLQRQEARGSAPRGRDTFSQSAQAHGDPVEWQNAQNQTVEITKSWLVDWLRELKEARSQPAAVSARLPEDAAAPGDTLPLQAHRTSRSKRLKGYEGLTADHDAPPPAGRATVAMSPASALHMRPAEAQRLRAAADVTTAFTTTSQGLLCSDMHRVHLDNGWQRFREEQMGVAKPLQLDGAVQWLRESAARAKERRKTSLCGPAHMWLLNQFDREVQAATCIQRAWRAYHQRVAGMSDEERKKMELRFRSQCARVAKALQGDRVTGVVAEFLAAITFGLGQTIESCAHKQGEASSHPASLPPAPETPPADFSTLSPMEKVRWTALSMTSYADKRRDVRLNTKEARKRLESGQEMLQGLLNKDLDLLKEVLLAKGEGAAGGSGSGAAARHASISKLVQKKVAEMADKAYSVLCQQQEAAKQQPSHPSPSSASIMAAVPAVATAAARRGSIAMSSWVLGVDTPGRASRTTHPGLGHSRGGARTSLPAAVLAALTTGANDALTIAPVAGALRNSNAATGASASAAHQLDPDSAAPATHAATFARARGKSDTLSAQYSQSVSRLSYAEPGSAGGSRRNSSAVVAAAMAVRLSQTHRMEPPRTMRLSYTAGRGGGSLLSFDECGGLIAAGTRLSVGAIGAGAESALAPGTGALAPGASEGLVVPAAARASWTAGFGAATAPSCSGSVAGAPIVGAAALAALLGLGPLIPLPALSQAPGCEQDNTDSADPEGGSDRIASVLAPSRDTSQVQPKGCRPASADAAPDFADPHKGKAVGAREAAARKLGGSARAGVARTGGSSRHAGTAQGVSPGYMLPQRQAKGGLPTALPKPPGMRVTPAPPTSPAPGARVRKPQRIVGCKGGAKAHVDMQAASRKAVAPGGFSPDPAVDSGEPSPPLTEASSSSGAGDGHGSTRWPRIPSSLPVAQEQRPGVTAIELAPPQALTDDVSLAVWATAAAAVATTISDAASPAAGDSLPCPTAGVSLDEEPTAPPGITVAKASSNKALQRCTAGNTATSGSGGGGMAGGGAAAVPSGGVWDSPVSATGSLLPAFWGPGGELEDAEGPHAAASSPVTPGLRPLVIKRCWDEQGVHAPDATPASPAAAVAASTAQALSPSAEDAMAVEGTVSNSPFPTSAAAGSSWPAMLLAVPQPPASLPSAPSSPRGRPAANHSPASPFGTAQPDSPKASGSPSAFGSGLLRSSSGLSPLASRHLPRPTQAPHHMGGPFHAQASALAAQALTPPVAFSGAPLMTQVPLGSAATSICPAGSNNAIASPFIGLSIKTRLAGAGAGASQKQALASPTKSSPSPLQLGSPAGLALATTQSQGLGSIMSRLAPTGPALQLQQPGNPLSRLGGGVGGTAFSPAGGGPPAAPSHLGAGGKPVRLPLAIKITGSGLGGAASTVAGGGGSSSAPCSPTHHRTSGALAASGVGFGSGTFNTEGTVFGPDRPGTPLPSSLQNILSQGRVQLQNPVHRLAIVGEQHVLNAHPGNGSGSSSGSGGSQFRVREGSRGSRSGPVSWSEPGHGDPETRAAIASALMVAGTRQVPQLRVQGQGQVQLLPPLQPGATAVGSRSRVKPQVVRGLGQEGSGGGSKGDLRIKASAALVTATLGSDRFANAALPEEAALLGMADRAPSASTAPEQEQRCTGPQRRGLQVHITWASSSAPCSPGPSSAELLPLPPLEWETPGDSAGQDEDGGTAGGEQLEGLQEELLVPPDRITLAGWRR